jgi:hypothetical protein
VTVITTVLRNGFALLFHLVVCVLLVVTSKKKQAHATTFGVNTKVEGGVFMLFRAHAAKKIGQLQAEPGRQLCKRANQISLFTFGLRRQFS